jgi:chromosome segregation ATPase
MRSHLSEAPRGGHTDSDADAGISIAPKDGTVALELVEQAADLFRKIEGQAQEFETRARTLAEGAIQKLQLAEDTIQALRNDKVATEARIAELHDDVRELGESLRRERARVAAAENRLSELEMRARTAEAKAEECENTMSHIEEAIRTKLLREGSSTSHRAAAA